MNKTTHKSLEFSIKFIKNVVKFETITSSLTNIPCEYCSFFKMTSKEMLLIFCTQAIIDKSNKQIETYGPSASFAKPPAFQSAPCSMYFTFNRSQRQNLYGLRADFLIRIISNSCCHREGMPNRFILGTRLPSQLLVKVLKEFVKTI